MIFAADKATFRRRDLGIETVLEVIVSPEHRAEIRRITLINHDAAPRELELTSYAEIVLAPRGADLGHPAFGKLFLETEWLPGPGAIVCRRRMRSADRAAALGRARLGRRRLDARQLGRSATSSTRPTGCGSSAAGGRSPTRPRWTPARSSRGRSARCSTRSSASVVGSGSTRAARRSWRSSPPWPSRATRR